jgi:hypothetical protein
MVCVLRPALALLLPPATKSMRDKSERHLLCFIARLEKSTPDIKSMAQKKLRVPEHLSLFAHPLCYWMLVALGHGGDQILLPPHYSRAEQIQHLHFYGIIADLLECQIMSCHFK